MIYLFITAKKNFLADNESSRAEIGKFNKKCNEERNGTDPHVRKQPKAIDGKK
jgi:hypothetical protein